MLPKHNTSSLHSGSKRGQGWFVWLSLRVTNITVTLHVLISESLYMYVLEGVQNCFTQDGRHGNKIVLLRMVVMVTKLFYS